MRVDEMLGSLRSETKVKLFSQEALELCQPPRRTDKHQPPGLRLFYKRCHLMYGATAKRSRTAALKLERLEAEVEKIAEKFTELEKAVANYKPYSARAAIEGQGVELALAPPPEVGFQVLWLLLRFDKLCLVAKFYLPAEQARHLIKIGKKQLRRIFSY